MISHINRVRIVFHASAYELSKCAVYSFYIAYSIVITCVIIGFAGLYITPLVFEIGFALGAFGLMSLAVYLPSLFVYKLSQINKKVKAVNKHNSSQERGNAADRGILAVIRKVAILTVFSMVSAWSAFLGGMLEIIVGGKFNVLVFWGYAIIMDMNINFICVMLSNSFCEGYYMKICAFVGIEDCVKKCCFDDGGDDTKKRSRIGSVSPESKSSYTSNPEKELSSYMDTATETTKATKESIDVIEDDQGLGLDLDEVSEIP